MRTAQTHAPVTKEKSQDVQTTTTAPSSVVTAPLTTEPLTTGGRGRVGPVVTPLDKEDSIIVSKYILITYFYPACAYGHFIAPVVTTST